LAVSFRHGASPVRMPREKWRGDPMGQLGRHLLDSDAEFFINKIGAVGERSRLGEHKVI